MMAVDAHRGTPAADRKGFSPVSDASQPSLRRQKQSLRERAQARRRAQPDKDRLSEIICRSLADLPEYTAARTILFYVDARSEVRTRPFLPAALAEGKQVVVPFCSAGLLELFRLEAVSELAPGSYQILEPRAELRGRPERRVEIAQIDLAVIPGVAFDTTGGRLGHGQGYYDKLLAVARKETTLVALAFECQLFAELPRAEHDVTMDAIITERAVYRADRRPGIATGGGD
jgi:5-formyltetrahydrofolate cyclo-ligase